MRTRLIAVVRCEDNVRLGFQLPLEANFVPSPGAILVAPWPQATHITVQHVVIQNDEYVIVNHAAREDGRSHAATTRHFADWGFVTVSPAEVEHFCGLTGVAR